MLLRETATSDQYGSKHHGCMAMFNNSNVVPLLERVKVTRNNAKVAFNGGSSVLIGKMLDESGTSASSGLTPETSDHCKVLASSLSVIKSERTFRPCNFGRIFVFDETDATKTTGKCQGMHHDHKF
jgi:hypothetical protein